MICWKVSIEGSRSGAKRRHAARRRGAPRFSRGRLRRGAAPAPAASTTATSRTSSASGHRPNAAAQRANGVRPGAALHLGVEHALRVRGDRVAHHAEVVDHDRGAGVGGAQHRPLEFERTKARDVQVLVDRDGVAEPADVAEVREDRRRAPRRRRNARPAPRRTGLRSRCSARPARPCTANEGAGRTPRLKSPSGMCISSVNQRKPVGMNSPNGTRWFLS